MSTEKFIKSFAIKQMYASILIIINRLEASMKEEKLKTITNLFEGNEIRSIWNSEKKD